VSVGAILGGRYEIVRHLGAGGMGTVYAARDRLMDLPVALKFVRGELARDSKEQARLREEIRLVQTITHPNVIRTFTLEQQDDRMFIVMDLLRGRTLQERLREGRPPVSEALAIARGVLAGLAAAHTRNIVHRDIKPQNIELCDDGRVVVMDFGIARARPLAPPAPADVASAAPVAPAIDTIAAGTPGYMAPEVLAGGRASVASDLFSLGVILDQMLPRYRDTGTPGRSAGFEAIVPDLRAQPSARSEWRWSSHGVPAEACRRGGPLDGPPRYGSGFTMAADPTRAVVFGVATCPDEPTLVRDVFVPGKGWRWVTDEVSDAAPAGTPFAVHWASGGYGVLSRTTAGLRLEWDGFAPEQAWAQASSHDVGDDRPAEARTGAAPQPPK